MTNLNSSMKEIMEQAFVAAQHSTCARRRVGAIIIDTSGSYVSRGWNHSSNGISCEAKFFKEYVQDIYPETAELELYLHLLQDVPLLAHQYEKYLSSELSSVWESFKIYTKTDEFKAQHKQWQNTEIHSELHAITQAYKKGASLANCILFSSRSPCIPCAHAIIESGIKKVYYTELSIAGEGGIPILEQAGIEVEHLPIETELYT